MNATLTSWNSFGNDKLKKTLIWEFIDLFGTLL
jgi:hypothetical protein